MIKTNNEIKLVSNCQSTKDIKLEEIFSKLKTNEKFYYEELRNELKDIEQGDDVLRNFYNEEKETYDEIELKSFNVEEGKDLEIYSENLLKTQKILMVMLWSYDLNKKKESPYVHPNYINEKSEKNGTCIKSVLNHFGIDNIIVVDYESAINELLKRDDKGDCIYYSVWIFCGPQYPIFPPVNGKENTSNPNLVEEFINILILFWKNGGALVFFAEGEPLNFQVNLFLEKIKFSEDKQVDFKISGDYYGDKTLEQDKSGKLDKKGIFDKSIKKRAYKGIEIQRQSLSHNLGLIYEGITIGYAIDKKECKKISFGEYEKLKPFIPFAINSEGGISTLIYEADEEGRGDIIIDCGYTKCFLNMLNTCTFRYIQNIAGWTARPEIIFKFEKKNPWEWRPKGINYKVNYNVVFDRYLNLDNKNLDLGNMKTLFAIDTSGSTNGSEFYYNELEKIVKKHYDEKRGDIFYLWNSINQKITKEELDKKIQSKEGTGETFIYEIVNIIENEKINNFKHLVIVTDGQVEQNYVSDADIKMTKINYEYNYVSVYVLGDNSDLSVGSPFCRSTPNQTFSKKKNDKDFTQLATLSREDIDIIKNMENYADYDKFMENYEKLLNAFQAQCIGTSENKQLEKDLNNIINKIIEKNQIKDRNLFDKRKDVLIGMTKGSLKNTFTLDKIKAAMLNYK